MVVVREGKRPAAEEGGGGKRARGAPRGDDEAGQSPARQAQQRRRPQQEQQQQQQQQHQREQQEKPVGRPTSGAEKAGGADAKKVRLGDGPAMSAGLDKWLTWLYEARSPGLSKIELYPRQGGFSPSDFSAGAPSHSLGELLALLAKPRAKALVVTAAALRACALTKPLATLKRPIAKLFAKHMKAEEQASFMKKNAPTLAVGTPNRIQKLAQAGALEGFLADSSALLVFDLHEDVKGYQVLTLPVVSSDCFAFLREAWLSRPADKRPLLAFICSDNA
jgi:hypothetical protein